MLLSLREMYGLGETGAVTKVLLLLLVEKDICWKCFRIRVISWAVEMGFYPPSL